jgi:hypothetical protein
MTACSERATAFLSALLTGNIALAVVTAPLPGALLGFFKGVRP